MNASDGSKPAATRRIGWIKFTECGGLLHEKRLLLKMKRRFHQSKVGDIQKEDLWPERKREGDFEN